MSFPLPDPATVKSLLETGLSLTNSQTGEAPSAITDVGMFVLDNWSPIASAGQALVGRRLNSGVHGVALPALGLGLATGVAKLGLSLLQRRLESRSGRKKDADKDRLRGVSERSKNVKKSRRSGGVTQTQGISSASSPRTSTPAPLQQLSILFPGLDRSLLGDMLASNKGNLEITIDQLLSFNVESSTPTPLLTSENFNFPDQIGNQGHPSLPPCPDCPVCLTSLANKRIYQCSNGHHVCQECKRNPHLKVCPTCRQKLVGRATNMEQFLESIYGNK